jgi:gamma-glutamylcyclotransferase (GGCT)/AIG2-like uncharacterized protein YtfP
MCAQLGVIFGTKRRSPEEQEYVNKLFGWLFTYLLLLSERRGSHATGVAMLKSDNEYALFKRPLKASEFVKDKGFKDVLDGIDGRTTLLMGHTRWQTRGDASNNMNNHPIRAGEVIGTHNGTILNADYLFKHFELPRLAEVDSELIFRIADATLDEGCLHPETIRDRLALCQGQISAMLASRLDTKTVMVIKGNKPLELRYHPEHKAIVYASDAACLDVVLMGDNGWRVIPTTPMSLMMFHCDEILDFSSEPFRLVSRSGFQRFTVMTRKRVSVSTKGESMKKVDDYQKDNCGPLRLFVYGTLKSGHWNHDRFCKDALYIEQARVRGRLYSLPSGIPVLKVPDADMLAVGTSDPMADVATQERLQYQSIVECMDSMADWPMIQGELVVFPDARLSLPPIDQLEGFHPASPSLYRRVLVPVTTGDDELTTAWCYVMGDLGVCRVFPSEKLWALPFYIRSIWDRMSELTDCLLKLCRRYAYITQKQRTTIIDI